MPFLERRSQRIYFEDTGSGPAIVLGHSLLCSGEMWEGQVHALAVSHRVVNIDYRGHGRSSRVTEDFTLYDLVEDTTAILDRLEIERAIWAGLSTGGMVALRAALTVPDRVDAIVVADASAGAEPLYPKLKNRTLGLVARLVGMEPLLPAVAPIMFGRTTLENRPGLVEAWRPTPLAMELASVLRFLEVVMTRDSLLDRLPEIAVPALIVVGEEDRAQPVARSRQMAAGIPGAELAVIPQAGHLSALEQPEAFNAVLLGFLGSLRS